MLRCIILSGVSGSGKDTWLKNQGFDPTNSEVFSADNYFMKSGMYKFDARDLSEAHASCMRQFVMAVVANLSKVLIVNNTNTDVAEIAPYYSVAKAFHYSVELVTLVVPPHIAAARNIHGVPENSVKAMHDRIQARKIPRFWDIKSYNVSTYQE